MSRASDIPGAGLVGDPLGDPLAAVPTPVWTARPPLATVDGCRLVEFPRIHDPRGNLTFVEGGRHIPFAIKRLYYLYDVPGGAERGGHAHKNLQQIIIAMSGSFDVVLDDGRTRRTVQLNRSYFGLLMRPMIWRELVNFSSGAVCAVLASEHYDEDDYLRDYPAFLAARGLGSR